MSVRNMQIRSSKGEAQRIRARAFLTQPLHHPALAPALDTTRKARCIALDHFNVGHSSNLKLRQVLDLLPRGAAQIP